jgi:hypothetical protein
VDNYTITQGGVYNMTVGSDGYYLSFPDPSGNLYGARIVISNTGYGDNFYGGIVGDFIPKYGASNNDVTAIGVGSTVNFVSDGQYWRLLPLTGITSIGSDGAVEDGMYITTGGVYSTNCCLDTFDVTLYLPPASALDGQTITVFNPRNGDCYLDGQDIYQIDNTLVTLPFNTDFNGVIEIVSVGGNWRIVNYQAP